MDDVDIRASTATRGRTDTGAIVAGAVVTVATGITLLALGAALGMTILEPGQADWGGRMLVARGGAWTMISIVVSTLVGAMTSARLSAHYSRSEAAAQGLTTWALAFVAVMLFMAWFAPPDTVTAGETAPAPADARTGAWAHWGLFLTSLLSAVAGAAGGVWGLPGAAFARAPATTRGEPLRPVEP